MKRVLYILALTLSVTVNSPAPGAEVIFDSTLPMVGDDVLHTEQKLLKLANTGFGISGGGGGAVTLADGASVTLGAKADTAATSDTGAFSQIALTKRGLQKLTTISTDIGTIATNTGRIPAQGVAAPSGSLPVVQATATTVVSTSLEASHVLKNSAGSLVSLHVFNSKASAQYILIMNSTTVPSDGAVTLLYPPINVPAGGNVSLNFTTPLTASTGISVSNSSTGSFTKTVGSSDCVFTAQVQ